jgi:hypothetical protein
MKTLSLKKKFFEAGEAEDVSHGGLESCEDEPRVLLPGELLRADHETKAGAVQETDGGKIDDEFAWGKGLPRFIPSPSAAIAIRRLARLRGARCGEG